MKKVLSIISVSLFMLAGYSQGTRQSGNPGYIVSLKGDTIKIPGPVKVTAPTVTSPTYLYAEDPTTGQMKKVLTSSVGGAGTAPNLDTSRTTTTVTVKAPVGYTDALIKGADSLKAGVMSASDWVLLKYMPKFFNVRRYGAVGDSTTNDTQAFRDCMAALIAARGGVFYIPLPSYGYRVDSIRIPALNVTTTVSIEIMGEQVPNFFFGTVGTAVMPHKGPVIFCNSTTAGAIILADANTGPDFSTVSVTIRNLDLRTYNNSQIGGIDVYNAAFVPLIENVFVNTNRYNVDASNPTNASIGIRTPAINNGAKTMIKNAVITGYQTGLEVNEHTYGEDLVIASCYYALDFKAGGHASYFTRIGGYRNKYNLKVSGLSYFTIAQYNIEHADSATQTNANNLWQVTWADVLDPSNLGVGEITWNVVHGNVGNDHIFTKVGGTGIQTKEIGTAAGGGAGSLSAVTAIGATTTDAISITGSSTTGPKFQVGGVYFQPYSSTNFILGLNMDYNAGYRYKTNAAGSSWNVFGGGQVFNSIKYGVAGVNVGTGAVVSGLVLDTTHSQIFVDPISSIASIDAGNNFIKFSNVAIPAGTITDSVLVVTKVSGTDVLKKVPQSSISGGTPTLSSVTGAGASTATPMSVSFSNATIATAHSFRNIHAGAGAGVDIALWNDAGTGATTGLHFYKLSSTFSGFPGLAQIFDYDNVAFRMGTNGNQFLLAQANGDMIFGKSGSVYNYLGLTGTGNRIGVFNSAGDLTRSAYDPALFATLASPALTGSPTSPTKSQDDNSTNIATTAYSDLTASKQVLHITSGITAPLARRAFTTVFIDPSSSVGASVIGCDFPGSPLDGDVMNVIVGGQIAIGGAVATNFQLTSSASITYGTVPSTIVGGDAFKFIYDSTLGKWKRVIL